MLERLSVTDFALMEAVSFDLENGFVAFTGETGAGKSLVVGAIGLLLGGRADASMVRDGAEGCEISGFLLLEHASPANRWLEEKGITLEDGGVLVKRGLKKNGRSYASIQNRLITRGELQEFATLFSDIHGQHDHQTLLDPARHLRFLDEFAGLEPELVNYRQKYDRWRELSRLYKTKAAEMQARRSEVDFLTQSVEEIKNAHLRAGEEEEILQREKLLLLGERLQGAIESSLAALGEDSGSIGTTSLVKKASMELRTIKDADPALDALAARLDSAAIELEDIRMELASYKEKTEFSSDNLEAVENRLAEIRRIKKKYGPDLEHVLTRYEKDKQTLLLLSSWEDDSVSLQEQIAQARDDVLKTASNLTKLRREAAAKLQELVEGILPKLGMQGATFPLSVESMRSDDGRVVLGPSGQDTFEFIIAPNYGEPPQPLAKIASGGELSRIALAIKAALSRKRTGDVLIFDEVDAGIGGQVALAVGDYLKELSRNSQVLCVTHLASIAAKADLHILVEKREEQGRTVTSIRQLRGAEREVEIARMLAGDKKGEASRSYAAELLAGT